MDISYIVILVLSILASAFSSAMEIAFVTSNKLKIELDKKQGVFAATIIAHFAKYPKMFIATMLVGNNTALVVSGLYLGDGITNLIADIPFLNTHLGEYGILLTQTVLSTIIILIFAEFIPKAIFSVNPNRWLNVFVFPLMIWYGVFYVFAFIITALSDVLLKLLFGKQPKPEAIEFGRVDLNHYLEQATGNIDPAKDIDHEIQIFQNALDFSKVKARDCLIPRNELVAVEITDSVEVLRKKFIETRLSKILIYRESIDHIIGYVHSFDLFKKPEHIQQMLRQVMIIPEPMTANEILERFIKEKRNMAVVVDEFGGTAGILTMEDIVEEIFGEIEDEHDKEETLERIIGQGEYEFSARLEIDYLNEKFHLNLPDNQEEYDTLGGLLLHLIGDIPEEQQVITYENWTFTALKVSETKVELVHIKSNKD
jgi:putative hemolysin